MVYIKVIYTGLLVFPFIAVVFTLPYAIYQYNRHGSVSKYRTLIIYSFILVSLAQVLVTKGLTLGHASCRMILVSENGGLASAGQLIKRYLCVWLFTEMPLIAASLLMNVRFAFIVDLVILGLTAVSRVYFIMYFINMVFRKGKLMPHDKFSGTLYQLINTAKEK